MSNKNKQSKQVSKSYSGASNLSKKVDNDEDGCPKINIDLKLESDILSFIRSTFSHHTSNGENRASHRLTKKRITDMYDVLVQTGFNKESIESAMFQCLPVGGDLVSLLDWLCLNTKDEDLPDNFSQVLKEEEQKLKPKIFVEEVQKIKPKPAEALRKKDQSDEQPSMKDWILKYAETQDSDDDGDDGSGDGNDEGSSFKMAGNVKSLAGNKSQLDDDLNERFISLVAKYFDLKSSKGKKDEMQSLLDELKVLRSKPGFDQRNKRLLNLDSEMRSISGEEEELSVGGLFVHEESSPDHGDHTAKARPSKDVEVRDLSYTRQQWTGKSPKQFFIDWMRKKMQSCSFSLVKVDAGGGKWRSKCILKRPAKEGGDLTVCPEILCNNVKDAEHLACTLLLYTLCKDKDLHLLLPPPYRDIWLDWKKMEKEKVAVITKESTKDRDAFVDKLLNKINSSKQTKKSDEVCIDSWEDIEEDDKDQTCKSSNTTQTSIAKNHRLVSECRQILESNRKSKQFQDLLREREELPVHGFKETIVDVFRANEVFIVAGETGSGKSTQVPQFVLEELLISSSSPSPFIVCTEPRRISAVSLSHRVSAEMGERSGPGAPKSLCGYQIRSEVKKTAHTRLLFCTTGVLLRRMQENINIGDVGCVIVDEVHERDLNTDVLLIHLLELLTNQQRVQGSKLKVILMSATLDCNKFSKYFFNCPIVSVQGRSHHVEVFHLENIIELTKYQLESDSPYSLPYEDIVQEESATLKVTGKHGEVNNLDVTWSKEDLFKMDKSGLDPKRFSLSTRNTLTRMNQEAINLDLILETLRWLLVDGGKCQNGKDEGVRGREGSVLLFLPGLAAIDDVREVLNSDPTFGDTSRFLILALHSVLSSKEQSLVFSTPPPGVRKVILSTNIAETGLTMPDVVYVIDCGREKQKRYLDSSRISQLRQVWVSQASAKQRQGRAGRVRPGVCFRLFTTARFSTMSLQGLPEIKRLPLQGLCLHIMKCYSRPVPEILSRAIDPPNPSSISTAMSILREVGACHGNTLTPLGHHLAKLPLDAKLGKILIYAGVLGCLEEASLMVSCMTEKSPFQSRLEREVEHLNSGRNQFDLFGSDQIATLLAVKRCLALKSRGERLAYCRKNALKFDVIKDIENSARELKDLVTECGLHSPISFTLRSDPNLLRLFNSSSSVDPKQATVSLLKAVLMAGLYPNVGRLVVEEKSVGRKKGSAEVHLGSGEVAFVHGSSVNRKIGTEGWIVFLDKEKQNRVSLTDTTLVTEIPLLLFGGEIQVQHQQHCIVVDNWIKFKAPAKMGVLMKEMKMRLDDFLDRKLHEPSLDVSAEPVLPLLIRLLVSNGKQQ